MQKQNAFIKWLEDNTTLASSTVEKYARAVNTISKELKEENLLEQNLFYINDPVIIEKYKEKYLSIPKYHAKDTRGNRMYSNALNYYQKFTKSTGGRKV